MVELRGGIKSAWTDIQNETSHKLVDGIRNRLMDVKHKRKSIKYRMKSYKVNTEFVFFFRSQNRYFKRKLNFSQASKEGHFCFLYLPFYFIL